VAHACGSYRRGRATCGDVDILVTHPDGKSHRNIFGKLLAKLKSQGNHKVKSCVSILVSDVLKVHMLRYMDKISINFNLLGVSLLFCGR